MPHPTKYSFAYLADAVELDGILGYPLDHIAINEEFYQASDPMLLFPITISVRGEVYNIALYHTDENEMILAVKDHGQWTYFKWRHNAAMGPSQKIQNIMNGLKKHVTNKPYGNSLYHKFVRLTAASIKTEIETDTFEIEYTVISRKPNGNIPWTTTREDIVRSKEELAEDERKLLKLFTPDTTTELPHLSIASYKLVDEAIYQLMNKADDLDEGWTAIHVTFKEPANDRQRKLKLFKVGDRDCQRLHWKQDSTRYVRVEDHWASSNFVLFVQDNEPQ